MGGSRKYGVAGPGGCLCCSAVSVSGESGASVSVEKRSRAAPLRFLSLTFSSTLAFTSYLCEREWVAGGELSVNCEKSSSSVRFLELFFIFCVSETFLSEQFFTCNVL